MSLSSPTLLQELNPLLEALCEERLTAVEHARLERLLLESPAAVDYYLQYLNLHGGLHWDTALSPESETPESDLVDATLLQLARPELDAPIKSPSARRRSRPQLPRSVMRGLLAVAACLILSVGMWIGNRTAKVVDPLTAGSQQVAARQNASPQSAVNRGNDGAEKSPGGQTFSQSDVQLATESATGLASENKLHGGAESSADLNAAAVAQSIPEKKSFTPVRSNSTAASTRTVLGFINNQLRAGWTQSGITPSPRADDAEWLRRVHLDLVGHIPSGLEVEKFLADHRRDKRALEIDRLLASSEFGRHFATIWTDLLIGRASRPEVNRAALAKFLRQSFQQNRPWTEIVYDLVAAEGRTDQNGAANFLVAHLNNGAIPATGIISRLFLGTQLQCAQCHNHPFDNTTQEQFWAFNSFFQQAVVVRDEKYDSRTGRMIVVGIELATKASEGPVYFETRSGLMKVAYPQYAGTRINPDGNTSRRRELARLMQSEGPGLAPAFVNRIWNHFHGRSFTPVVDDMGPHNPPSHPELLDRLSEEFALSGYDVKQLIRWVCNSESYQLTSRFSDGNSRDNPEAGEMALFSRVYVKPMTAAQLYDSLVVATQGQLAGGPTMDQSDKTRDQWLGQFVVSFETEENDETSTLDGSITQSLLMMNGDLMREATSIQAGTWLHKLLIAKHSETERIQTLFHAALSRPATQRELGMVKKLLKNGAHQNGALENAYQDIYWALLNSNEFILNH